MTTVKPQRYKQIMTFTTKGGILYQLFSEPYTLHYHILSKDGGFI